MFRLHSLLCDYLWLIAVALLYVANTKIVVYWWQQNNSIVYILISDCLADVFLEVYKYVGLCFEPVSGFECLNINLFEYTNF